MSSQEERWAKWDDLRARQAEATTALQRWELAREEEELRQQGVRELLSEDMLEPFGWWWLSFVDIEAGGFLGVAIVEAGGVMEASIRARALGCNPGGEVQGYPLTPEQVPAQYRERLLSEADLKEAGLA